MKLVLRGRPRQNRSLFYLKIMQAGVATVLLLAPIYTALAIWLTSAVHHADLINIWKEILVAAIFLSLLASGEYIVVRFLANRLTILIGIYCLLLIGIGIYDLATHRVSKNAVIYSWVVDLRPFGIFALALLTSLIALHKRYRPLPWAKLVVWPAVAVIIFGLLQFTVLPKDILSHIGYSSQTLLAYQTVDNQPSLARVQSTLRGPNPLGAYLVLIIPLFTVMAARRRGRARLFWVGSILLGLIVMFATYSRSADVGLVLAMLSLAVIYGWRYVNRLVVILSLAGLLVLGTGLVASRHSYFVQNLIFHTSKASTSPQSADAERNAAIERAVKDVYHHPFGGGIGSAGPASLRNNKGEVKLAENYYLQIGQEAGVIGMALFIAIICLMALELWRLRENKLASVLLASLVGISFINLLLHAWADDTLAYVWWGLAGIVLAPVILKRGHLKNKNGRLKEATASP